MSNLPAVTAWVDWLRRASDRAIRREVQTLLPIAPSSAKPQSRTVRRRFASTSAVKSDSGTTVTISQSSSPCSGITCARYRSESRTNSKCRAETISVEEEKFFRSCSAAMRVSAFWLWLAAKRRCCTSTFSASSRRGCGSNGTSPVEVAASKPLRSSRKTWPLGLISKSARNCPVCAKELLTPRTPCKACCSSYSGKKRTM